jgi:hypothetical protein
VVVTAVIVCSVLLGTSTGCVLLGSPCADKELQALLEDGTREGSGGSLRMVDYTRFEWDRFFVFGPYTTPDQIEHALGLDWKGAQRSGIAERDGICLLVFVNDSEVVRFVEQPRDEGDWADVARPQPFTPRTARFHLSPYPSEYQDGPWPKWEPPGRADAAP